ncbi:GNAT family N-acetyltransferase [Ketogulonicigenium vulgare]|uniref:Acetyltransferase, gnat family protein n=1 Tax=Ketogulonicigenium vulgare (strain WSH-001) TaxID=759362 RepID=F9Y3G1_KETVW|nr:GNAT family N-acetyltransferase [Ketogulonicigenium vulgare]ADO43294.1 putative acetyltransferase [Ketogulonicigenium vulgare Y25]AEM41581.1 Acetyltransferase, gnat family protein [Ketogulonicigenium vulgare WSH-001]ALJ81700.1 GNAT family acetyltransferase [Ketogulonicigenium vulgare]ANW34367.1 GNAT family acetyltransferase [Ketogulonicigenium vulgare]AOZ55331.1 acetyltransferase [Ketogulonicigenium vulgare]
MTDVTTRSYQPADHDACLALFDGNVPHFFDPSERADYVAFLADQVLRRPYIVLEQAGRIIACGGLQVLADQRASFLSWGMVARDLQGQGIGRHLTMARIALARATEGVDKITLNTSQHTQGFYARFGFTPVKVTLDGYGPGLDRWDMVLDLRLGAAKNTSGPS